MVHAWTLTLGNFDKSVQFDEFFFFLGTEDDKLQSFVGADKSPKSSDN